MISALRVQAIPGEEGRNIEPTTWTQDTEPSSDDACKRRSRSRLSLRDLSEIRDRCAPIITRQVASDLGTLGTSLGRAGRIRQLLGALGAVAVRMAACSIGRHGPWVDLRSSSGCSCLGTASRDNVVTNGVARQRCETPVVVANGVARQRCDETVR